MLTIFNRKELLITMDMEVQAEVRATLAQNGIEYMVKTKNMEGSRGRTGSFGINQAYVREYKIYVHKKDYDKACMLIH